MKKWMAILGVMAAVVPIGLSASDDDPVIVKFDGGIGVDPVGGFSTPITIGTVTFRAATVNTVRGIAPGGVPWTIRNLKATVEVGGELDLKGRGLVLAGSDRIGTSLGLTVRAMLFCGGTTAFTSQNATLDPNGDFEIDGFLNPPPPNPCTGPTLLIVSGATPQWLAAGIPDNDDKN